MILSYFQFDWLCQPFRHLHCNTNIYCSFFFVLINFFIIETKNFNFKIYDNDLSYTFLFSIHSTPHELHLNWTFFFFFEDIFFLFKK